jgi:hypothetical protein
MVAAHRLGIFAVTLLFSLFIGADGAGALPSPRPASSSSRIWSGAASFLAERLSAAGAGEARALPAAAAALARMLLLREPASALPPPLLPPSSEPALPDELDATAVAALLSGRAPPSLSPTPAEVLRGRHVRALDAVAVDAGPASPCSGVGALVELPAAPLAPSPTGGLSFTCNAMTVSGLAFNGITASQAPPPGVPSRPSPAPAPLRAAALAAALATTPNVTRNGVLDGAAQLPPGTNLRQQLLPQQQAAVARGAGVASITQVSTVGQLLSDALLADPLGLALVLSELGPDTNAALLANTTCVAAPVADASASAAPSSRQLACVCPHDYHGAACEFGLGYQCAAVLADPLYHACVATNGAGFAPLQQIADVSGAVRSAELSPGALSAGRSGGGDNSTASTAAAAAAAWLRVTAQALLGLALAEAPLPPAPARMPPAPSSTAAAVLAAGAGLGYSPSAAGAPPCLFLMRNSTSAGDTATPPLAPLSLTFRVSCGWQRRSVVWTDSLSAGQTLVDPAGAPFALKLPRGGSSGAGMTNEEDAANLEALEAVLRAAALTSPRSVPFTAGGTGAVNNASLLNQPGAVRCNGSAVTRAFLDVALGALGTNRSAAARAGRGAPFFGLACAEQSFSYLVGGGDAMSFDAAEAGPDGTDAPAQGFSAPFALSRPPPGAPNASALALRLRVASPTRTSDSELTALIALTDAGGGGGGGGSGKGVLIGGANVLVPLPLPGPESAAGAWWAGGRLALEARVVAAPLGVGEAAALRLLQALRDPAQVPSNATRSLAASLSLALGVGPARLRFPPQPLLLLSNLHALALDDAAFAEPRGESMQSRAVRLALTIGLSLLVAASVAALGVRRWRRAAAASDAKDE